MNDRSATTRSKRCAAHAAANAVPSRARAFSPSKFVTRGSAATRGSSWPRPTSTPTTCAAPRCSSTSLKPPLPWPRSRQVLPRASMPAVRERGIELQPTARDEAQLGVVGDPDLAVGRQVLTGLARRGPAARPEPAHPGVLDQPLRGGTRRRDAAAHEQLVGTHRVEASRRFRSGVSSGTNPACTAPASARRCTRPVRRSARSASRRPSSGAAGRPSRRGASAARRPCRRRTRRCA